MKNVIILLLLVSNLSSWNVYGKEENIFWETQQEFSLIYSPVITLRKDFTLKGKNYVYEYKFDNNIVRIAIKKNSKSFQNEIYSNGVVIGKLQENSWSSTPYYYKNKNLGLLFIEEGDEQGVWGYSIFLVKERKIKEIGFMAISSAKNSPLNKFLSLVQRKNLISVNFLEPQIFSDEKIMDKSEQIVQINLNTLKILNIYNHH